MVVGTKKLSGSRSRSLAREREREREREMVGSSSSPEIQEEIVYNVDQSLERIIGCKSCTKKECLNLVWKYVQDKNLLVNGVVEKDAALEKCFRGRIEKQTTLPRIIREHLSLPSTSTSAVLGGTGRGNSGVAQVVEGGETWKEQLARTGKKRKGVFSLEEDNIIRKKVQEIAKKHNLSTTDYTWLYNTRKHGKKKKGGLWSQIATALPDRTVTSVHSRGIRLFNSTHGCKGETGRWSKEEDEALKKAVEEHGTSWNKISQIVGRSNDSCKDHWRQVLQNKMKKVPWTKEEEESLKTHVENFLSERSKSSQQNGSGGGSGSSSSNLTSGKKDDISWVKVSKELGTGRTPQQCLQKWYKELCPSMVSRGDWGQGEDVIFLKNLADWCNENRGKREWQTPWEKIVPGRSSAQTNRRWKLMLKHIPDYQDRSFFEQVMYLKGKYLK